MDIEIPIFEGNAEQRRAAMECFLVTLAERLKSSDFSIISISRTHEGEGCDEIDVTYKDGRRARYLLTRIK